METNKPIEESNSNLTQRILLSSIGHKLRTPLNAIIGYSELLIEEIIEPDRRSLVQELKRINSAGKEILALVNEVLDPSTPVSDQHDQERESLETKVVGKLSERSDIVISISETLVEKAKSAGWQDIVPDLVNIENASKQFVSLIADVVRFPMLEARDVSDDHASLKDLVEGVASGIAPVPEEPSNARGARPARILIVDDTEMNRDILARHLKKHGYEIMAAEDGHQALNVMDTHEFDLILLDIIMPEMNGLHVLQRIKRSDVWRDIPVIMISSLGEMDSVVACIEMGADDYLTKPFNPILLNARIHSSLEKKRLHDLEKEQKRILEETFGKYVDQEVRDEVLSGRIPVDGEIKNVSVLFADLRDFTPLTESTPPKELVRILNSYFTAMTPAISRHHGSLLRVVGDEIFAVFGAPLYLEDHPTHAVKTAVEMRRLLLSVNENLVQSGYDPLKHGVGIHSGPVVAANIGSSDRLCYDLVGATVNLASRIQDLTKTFAADIIISAETEAALSQSFLVEDLPATMVKGIEEPVQIFRVL